MTKNLDTNLLNMWAETLNRQELVIQNYDLTTHICLKNNEFIEKESTLSHSNGTIFVQLPILLKRFFFIFSTKESRNNNRP